AGARPAPDRARRAAHRARRRLRPPGQDRAARARARRRHRDHDHAYPGGGRAHGRPHRRHRRRPADRPRHAGGAARAGRQERDQPGGHLSHPRRRSGRGRVSAPGSTEHFPEKWLPVFRRKCDHSKSLFWFAQHESRLAWRDWLSMMTAGRRRRAGTVALALLVFAICMHLLAYSMVGRFADVGLSPDKTTLVVVTGSLLLSGSLMLSQAMESVTRAFYARSDLDLILTSPAALRKLFSVRIATMALTIVLM